MVEPSESSRNKASRIISLSQRDLLRLLANERGVREFFEISEEDAQRTRPEKPHVRTTHIFLSYARQDIELVNHLYDSLVADGFTPWMDAKSLLPGEKWKHAIQRAIRRTDFFLVCLSRNSINKRGFLQKEIRIALEILDEMLDDDIYLIPVRLEECDMPDCLSDFQWVNLFEGGGYERLIFAIREGEKRRNLTNHSI